MANIFLQPDAWTTIFALLNSHDANIEAKLFAATTLKGKVSLGYGVLHGDMLRETDYL